MVAAVTFRTTDDILYALDTHPAWLAAVRAQMLTQEILWIYLTKWRNCRTRRRNWSGPLTSFRKT